ncbi:tetrahydrofolate dehydrogenase/cyclohydrolase, NAD(P)-binding domain protein [Clostridiales bacterium oral taxon 876 str. F0540]|nr:tetrahydrofolate dehydrogenase/cyclohydrolase, NAD(P)-binding domain protein [Clostridiales bacterium oral taxon 876 str. F0540]
MGMIIDGKTIAEKYRKDIIKFTEEKKNNSLRVPCLATILVGEDGGSLSYANNQKKLCEKLGLINRQIIVESSVKEDKLIEIIEELNSDCNVDGIIVQLPLPGHINEKTVTSHISSKKDVDGLTDINTGKFYKGEDCFVPCTPQSILNLIKTTGCEIKGKHAVIVGRSNIVGKPAAQLLLNENATVTICHSKTTDLKEVCKTADILVCALGKPNFITKEYIKEGAVVIDVGTSMVNGKLTGDICFDEVIDVAGFLTPVPGGVGALTTTMLIKNTCEAMIKNVC